MSEFQIPPVVTFVGRQTTRLADGFLRDDPTAKAGLAEIRKCADGKIHPDPAILQWTLEGLPECNRHREWAASLTLGLFALTQRANHERSAVTDTRFMTAVSKLADNNDQWAKGLVRSFRSIQRTDSPELLAHRLRAFANQLNSEKSGANWGWLAFRLEQWHNPNTRDQARLAWGREFFNPTIKPENNK